MEKTIYGKLVEKDGKTRLLTAPKNLSERARGRFGFMPVVPGPRDPKRRPTGRVPVLKDGYIEMTYTYAEK